MKKNQKLNREILFFRKTGEKIRCLACSHYCQIAEGMTGICGVRKNLQGKLKLLVYGRPAAVNLDPIEKKPLYHFLPGSTIFSLGTYGCNFRCSFCQNWDISQISKGYQNFEELIEKTCEEWSPEKIVDYCLKNQIPAIAYTYNEPTVFVEYCYETMKLAKKSGIKNVFVSNGYQSKETIEIITPYLDAINIDLKSFREEFYQRFCGAHLEPVLENIKRFYKKKVWIEITTLLIPQENDSEEEIKEIAQFIAKIDKNIPWHLSRFFPAYQMLNKIPTDLATLKKAYQIGKKVGLNYIYLGNIVDKNYESTFCPKCGKELISRIGYEIKISPSFKNGRCLYCQEKIAGYWKT